MTEKTEIEALWKYFPYRTQNRFNRFYIPECLILNSERKIEKIKKGRR